MAPRIKPGNPQWAEWLKEHADMLEEKGNKSCDSFRKAAKSLMKNPHTYTHPEEALELVGVGPATVKYILKRMEAECERTGEDMPQLAVKERKQSAPKKPTKKKKGDLNSEDERKDDAAKEARRQRLTGKAGAAPVDEDVPPPPSKAKKTLERAKDKALDSDDPDGDPAKEARRQRLTGKGPAQAPAILPAPRSDSVTDLLLARIQAADKAEERAAAAAREAKRQRVGDVPVPRRVSNGSGPSSDAMASLMRNYVAPAKKADMYAPPPEVRRLAPDPESDHDAPVRPSPIWRPKGYAAKVSQAQSQALAPPQAASTSQLRRTQSAPGPAPAPANARAGPSGSKAAVRVPPAAALLHQSTSKPLPTSYDRYGGEHAISRHPLDPFPDPTLASIAFADFVPIRLEPGTFKVILIVDTREVAAKAKRTEITDKLEKENVRVDRKMLPLGDMIWVARPCYPDGTPTGGEDVVLDAVVERKRLDDLCGSIKDGRYTGQKVRMKHSAISHRIYLIEKYNTEATYAQWGPQIWTAKTQLQIHDGCYLHISSNLADTITYLKLRTQVMIDLFEKTTLYVIPKDHISRDTYVGLQQHLRATQPGRQYLTAYSSFDMLNKTDASLSVRQQWAKMVQHVNGVSAEMTVPFIARWPTPIQFYEETMIHRLELEDQNGMEVDEPPAKGRGKAKKRLAENFVTETLAEGRGDGDMGARCIKGVNGVKLWDLATATGKYPTKASPVKGGKD